MNRNSPAAKSTAVLTIRVPARLKKRIESLARRESSNRSRLAVEAIENYVEEREAQLARVDEGLRDAEKGRLVPHSKVRRYLKSWGAKRRLAPPLWK